MEAQSIPDHMPQTNRASRARTVTWVTSELALTAVHTPASQAPAHTAPSSAASLEMPAAEVENAPLIHVSIRLRILLSQCHLCCRISSTSRHDSGGCLRVGSVSCRMHSVKVLFQASALSCFATQLLHDLDGLGWYKPSTSETFGSQRQLKSVACAWASSDAAVQAAVRVVSSHLTSLPFDVHASPHQIQPDPDLILSAVLCAAHAHVEWCASCEGRNASIDVAARKEAASLVHERNRQAYLATSSADAEEYDSKSVRSEDSSTNASASSAGVGRTSRRGFVLQGTFACNLCYKVDNRGLHVPLGDRCRREIRRRVNAARGDSSGIAEGWEALQRWEVEKKKKSASEQAPSERAPSSAAPASAGSCSLCCRPLASTSQGKSKHKCGKPGSDRCLQLFQKLCPSRLPGSDDRVEPKEDIVNMLCVPEDEVLDFLGIKRGSQSMRFTRDKRPVVIFGGPGTGKSFTVIRLVQVLRAVLGVAKVPLLAAYGLVAQNVGGVTLHSWAGIGPCDDAQIHAADLLQRMNARAVRRWKEASVLVIDDASILSKELFDALEEVARLIRDRDVFFGGILLVLQLDVEQLLPVSTDNAPRHPLYPLHTREAGSMWWETLVQHSLCIHLQTQFRFPDDSFLPRLQDALRCRDPFARSSAACSSMTSQLCSRVSMLPFTASAEQRDFPSDARPTWLCPRRAQVISQPPAIVPSPAHDHS